MSQIEGTIMTNALNSSMAGEIKTSLNCGCDTGSRVNRDTHSLPPFLFFLPNTSHHPAYYVYIFIFPFSFVYFISAIYSSITLSSVWAEILLGLVHCCIFSC